MVIDKSNFQTHKCQKDESWLMALNYYNDNFIIDGEIMKQKENGKSGQYVFVFPSSSLFRARI